MRFSILVLLCVACASTPAKKESPNDEPPPSTPAKTPPPVNRLGGGGGGGKRELEDAKKLANGNDLNGAIAKVKESIAKNPNNEEAYLLLGSACAMKDDVECEKDAYKQGTASLPQSAALLNEKGLLELRTGDVKTAVATLEKANQLAGKKDPKMMADLAYAYIFVNRLDEGDKLAKEARALDPQSIEAAMSHGEVLLRKKDGKNAALAFTAALGMTTDSDVKANLSAQLALAYAMSAAAFMSADQPKDAVTEMEKSVKLAPDDARFLGLLMKAQEKAGDKKGAALTKKRLDALGVK